MAAAEDLILESTRRNRFIEIESQMEVIEKELSSNKSIPQELDQESLEAVIRVV